LWTLLLHIQYNLCSLMMSLLSYLNETYSQLWYPRFDLSCTINLPTYILVKGRTNSYQTYVNIHIAISSKKNLRKRTLRISWKISVHRYRQRSRCSLIIEGFYTWPINQPDLGYLFDLISNFYFFLSYEFNLRLY